MVGITTTGLVALLASSAAMAARLSPKFKLETVTTNGNSSLGGEWVTLTHTGAGLNAVVTVPEQADGTSFQLLNGFLVYHFGTGANQQYYTFALEDSRPQYMGIKKGHPTGFKYAAPEGYLGTSDNIGSRPRKRTEKQGVFSTGAKEGVQPLQFNRVEGTDWSTFAVCKVKGITYEGTGANEVLYRIADSEPDAKGQCADVGFRAHFI